MIPSLEEALARLASHAERYLFFDYDGTLCPIVSRPAQATVHRETVRCLEDLSHIPGTHLGVVTGRSLVDIRERLPVTSLIFAAVHGLVIDGGKLSFIQPEAVRLAPAIRHAAGRLRSELGDLEGVEVEDKELSVAVHYRRAESLEADRAALTARRIASQEVNIRCVEGKKVVELRPDVDWDKGKAVEFIVEELSGSGWKGRVGMFYAGDDRTDEDAFLCLGAGAVTVHVGEMEPTAARFRVKGPDEIIEVVNKLALLLRQ